MAVFIGSYRPAMRSNISRTWSSGRRPEEKPACASAPAPAWAAMAGTLLQLGQEGNDVFKLFRWQFLEGGHRRGGVDQRARDSLRIQARGDGGGVGARSRVAVVADLVAGPVARPGVHPLYRLRIGH